MEKINVTEAERIRHNYCIGYITEMLLHRFSVEQLTNAAIAQGLKKTWPNRNIEEICFVAEKVYDAMDERLIDTMVLLEMYKYKPLNTYEINQDDLHYFNTKFEGLFYRAVGVNDIPAAGKKPCNRRASKKK